MVWWFTSTRHLLAIGGFARMWIAGSIIDRFVIASMYGGVTFIAGMLLGLLTGSLQSVLLFVWLGTTPWWFWVWDAVIDHFHVRGDLAKFLAQEDVILATRCEYVGGHPQLPHGRFAYLLLEGTRESPSLTLGFPPAPGEDMKYFQMPVLDVDKMKPDSQPDAGIAGAMLAGIDEKAGKLFSGERVTLTVDYKGVGRTYHVEITHFFGGGNEVRNWRNYLICAQAEADAGVVPFGPWKSLKPGFPFVEAEEVSDDGARDGHQQPLRRSAFARR